MKLDRDRISRYLLEITKNGKELKSLVETAALRADSLELKAAKYLLIELAEAVTHTLQHILAKHKGIAVSGYVDTIMKARREGIVSVQVFDRLKPFLDFRNSLVHR